MTISAIQWEKIEKVLKGIYMPDLIFTFKSHEVLVTKMPVDAMTMRLEVFIDGKISGEWITRSTPMEPIIQQVWNKKTIRKYKKVYTFPIPYFKSTRTFLNQYKKIKGLSLTPKTAELLEKIEVNQ